MIPRLARHVPVLLRGRPLHGPERYRPFFIVGSGRCGTTVLRAILEAHPDVHIPPENYGLAAALRAFSRYSRLPWGAVLRLVLTEFEYDPQWEAFELTLGAVFRELAATPRRGRDLARVVDAVYRAHARRHKPAATRWGDKTPQHAVILAELRDVFPDLQVVHIVRDGRDVVASFIAELPEYDLDRAANQWLRHVGAARAFGARYPAQYCEIRYEALIARPQPTLERVAEFLGIGFDERMLRHHELHLRLGDVERLPHLQGARLPLYTSAIGRWRSDLTAPQRAAVERLLGATLAELGYGIGSG